MRALYNVNRCKYSPRPYTKHKIGGNQGQTRRYYIAAMETYWDYVPRKTSATGEDITHPNAYEFVVFIIDFNLVFLSLHILISQVTGVVRKTEGNNPSGALLWW